MCGDAVADEVRHAVTTFSENEEMMRESVRRFATEVLAPKANFRPCLRLNHMRATCRALGHAMQRSLLHRRWRFNALPATTMILTSCSDETPQLIVLRAPGGGHGQGRGI
jgi:hypothetical protein